jgi:hypothetical protein
VIRHFLVHRDDGTVCRVELPQSGAISDLDTGAAILDVSVCKVEVVGDPPTLPEPYTPPRRIEQEHYVGAWGSDGKGGRVKVGRPLTVRVHVPEQEPAPKRKTKTKGAA